MNTRVLISAPYFQAVLDRFRETFAGHGIELAVPHVEEKLSASQLIPLIGDIDGVICGDDEFTEEVLNHAPRLKVLSKWGTGIDSIDLEACRKRNIRVCNSPNAFSEPVADTALGYMLTFARSLHVMQSDMKSGRWIKKPGRALNECTVGVVGVGNIGKAVVQRLAGFGSRILGNDPIAPPADFLDRFRVEMMDKDRLFQESDFVTLHCDLNPTSHHIINENSLNRFKPGCCLINTGRGRLIDEAALVRALEDGRLAGAALDVFEQEPLPAGSRLRDFPSVFLAPHNSNSSPKAWESVHKRTLENLILYLRDGAGG